MLVGIEDRMFPDLDVLFKIFLAFFFFFSGVGSYFSNTYALSSGNTES